MNWLRKLVRIMTLEKQLDIRSVFCIMELSISFELKGFERTMAFIKTSRWICILIIMVGVFSSTIFAEEIDPQILTALDNSDTAQALISLDGAIRTDPSYAYNYLLKGKIFNARGKFEEALEQFEITLDKKSKLYEALYLKGSVLLKQGKINDAEKDFNKGINKAKEEKSWFHNGLGLVFMEREEYTKADIEFRKAIQIGPDQAEFHVNLGDANYFSKIYPLAINEYNQVIEMDTTNLDVYFRLARAYMVQNQYTEALNQLSIVLSRDTTYAYAWKEAGKLYIMAGLSARDQGTKKQRFTETIGSYRKFLELSNDSTDGEVFFNIGRAYFNLGGYESADSALSYVLSIGDVPSNIYLYLGRSKIALEQYQVGIDNLIKHIEWMKGQDSEWEPDADLNRRIADAYKALDDYASAASYYVKASELEPENSRYAVSAAISFHQIKEYADALIYYDRRIDIGPDDAGIYLNASYCTLQLEDWGKSVDYLLKVVELDSTKTRAYLLISDTYIRQLGDCENGILWTEKAYALDTTNCEALITLGFSYFGAECYTNYLKAIGYFKRALNCFKEKGMDNCGSANVMLYVAQGYHLHAADLLEKDKKEESRPFFKDAFDWYNKVLKCEPGNADAKQGKSDTEFEF
ncbi:MAG: tetratricopeptide repeat protein [Candidatus Zixiibacteriota bacterium]